MSLKLKNIPEEEFNKIRFVLKLWIVTNDTSINCLRWNRDQTIVIVNMYELMKTFRSDETNIFLCKTAENFLWLMYKHAFETCTSDKLEASERNEIESEYMLFTHPQFIGRNFQTFEAWLLYPEVRMHEIGQKGHCTLPSQIQFTVRENVAELAVFRMKIMTQMMHLESQLRKTMCEPGNASIEIPQAHVDYQVMDEPDYFKTKEIEGNYGPVSVSALKNCLGDLLPTRYDDFANEQSENANDVMETNEEFVTDEMSQDNDSMYIVEHPDAVTTETTANRQFHDLRELYENADFLTDGDGNMFEYHEIYEVNGGTSQEANITGEKEEDGNAAESPSIQPTQSTENVAEMDENMAIYLTNSMQACLPAID